MKLEDAYKLKANVESLDEVSNAIDLLKHWRPYPTTASTGFAKMLQEPTALRMAIERSLSTAIECAIDELTLLQAELQHKIGIDGSVASLPYVSRARSVVNQLIAALGCGNVSCITYDADGLTTIQLRSGGAVNFRREIVFVATVTPKQDSTP